MGQVLLLVVLFHLPAISVSEEFMLGYLTGSQRRPGDREYPRPGLTISGAISLAVERLNKPGGDLDRRGHKLAFTVAETYGEETTSIWHTAALWTEGVVAYIGPQETCVHEGRMAASFNLPMISYFCAHHETSDKTIYPTFARTRPPATQISKSVAALLLAFNWTQVTFFYLESLESDFGKVASTIMAALHSAGVKVRSRTWDTPYHHGYTDNPFEQMVQDTYQDTRKTTYVSEPKADYGNGTAFWSRITRLFYSAEYSH